MTSNHVQESLLIAASALLFTQCGAASAKRLYARLDAQEIRMVSSSDPSYVSPRMRTSLNWSVLVNLVADVALVVWFVVRGPYAWWWLLPVMFTGSAFAGKLLLTSFLRSASLMLTIACLIAVYCAVAVLWIWY
jgi:hypothetical protein